MKLQFIGHAAVYFETDHISALIDPFISGNPQAACQVDDFKHVDTIFVTHGHGDHLGDTIEIAKKSQAIVITNYEIACYLSRSGINTHAMHIGGRKKFNFGIVKMTTAVHGSAIETDEQMLYGGNPAGFVIEAGGKKIYHAGDTGLTLDMKLLERENIDLALLPVGGNFTMDIEDAAIAVDLIKPEKVMPFHYNTFDLIQVEINEFKDRVTGSEVIILQPGQTLTI